MITFQWKGSEARAELTADGWAGQPPDCDLSSFADESGAAERLNGPDVKPSTPPVSTPSPAPAKKEVTHGGA